MLIYRLSLRVGSCALLQNAPQAWFFSRCTGTYSSGERTIFWYGLPGLDDAKAAVTQVLPDVSSSSTGTYSSSGGMSGTPGVNFVPKRTYASAPARPGRKARVGIIGARGYVGQELMKVRQALATE